MKIIKNPDTETVQLVRQKLKQNDGYCPCKLIKNQDTLCVCKEFREAGLGPCHCGLYIKVEK